MRLTFTMLIALMIIISGTAVAQQDGNGKIDTVTLVSEQISDNQWMVSVYLFNDEDIAALDIPLKYSAGVAKITLDSISYAGSRIEHFQQKYKPVENDMQTLRFGGLEIGPKAKPLKAGDGLIGKGYLTVEKGRNVDMITVDTATAKPAATMMLSDVNAYTIIPALKIKNTKGEAKEEAKKLK